VQHGSAIDQDSTILFSLRFWFYLGVIRLYGIGIILLALFGWRCLGGCGGGLPLCWVARYWLSALRAGPGSHHWRKLEVEMIEVGFGNLDGSMLSL
jgi:hypothetical protein